MNSLLLIGNGAREHAIAESICTNEKVKLFAFMSANNPGIAALVKKSDGAAEIGDIHSPSAVVAFAKKTKPSLAFPSPDAVLAAGVTDALMAEGIKCAAPMKEAARLEWDKSYARELLKDFKVPGAPRFGIFDSAAEASSFIDSMNGKVAVKPSGLTGGKGVKVTGYQLKDGAEAKQYAKELLSAKHSGLANIVIEEKLEGEEFSLQAFSDGSKIYGMPLVQDHKRAYEGDIGPNTGGMGSYSDANHLLPFLRASHRDEALAIMQKTIEAFRKKTSKPFIGILYGGFMATRDGVKLIEYNARFGDPEAMNVLSILESDLYETLQGMASGRISRVPQFEKKATVCKYLVPDGYPGKSVTDQPLEIGYSEIAAAKANLFYAAVYEKEGTIYTQSSRSIGLVGIADTINEAEKTAESACSAISGKVWHRKDIGTAQLVARRIAHMKALGVL
ncbi:MAG: phosphoribosylamine--glycine ligase [Candidatus Micrarchaeota archaeon]|nr:phosphoribosylamine--glycine ligase [Candidatus Micrarchaeota archaeon]